MDSTVNSAVSSALMLEQAQSAQQVQMQVFKQALETQKDQVSELLSASGTGPRLASEGALGTRINTYA